MTTPQTGTSAPVTQRKPLRLWPGVVLAVLLVVLRFIFPLLGREFIGLGVMGGMLCALLVLLWWLFFSRAPWLERLGALALITVAMFGTWQILHESIRGGMMGMMFGIYTIPILCLGLVAWAAATRQLESGPRRAWLVAMVVLVCGGFALIRTGGISGDAGADLHWRWTETPEDRLLARKGPDPAGLASADAGSDSGAEWPGFRGPARDSVVRGVRIRTEWAASPPEEMWRRPIGPAWSSFAVDGDLLYTQEQRGDDEVVACYKVSTGEPVWMHRDATRFYESNAGAGPRGTPTLSDGRVYSLGGTGLLNALDAGNGEVVWTRNAATDTGGKVPHWGFSSSPLVVGDVVIVYAGGLAGFDRATGTPRWVGEASGVSYSSPHLVTIDGVTQILQLSGDKVTSVAPEDGKVLWQHPLPSGARIVQPAQTPEGDLLIHDSEYDGTGLRRVAVKHEQGAWTVQERWVTTALRPYYNDFVVHKGHAFGFDGSMLACIEIQNGQRKWKGGRYGHGQLVLLADQDLLLVLSEKGELALVEANPDTFKELARLPAIEGKTWNHPVLAGDELLVRNAQEMAAFRLSLAEN